MNDINKDKTIPEWHHTKNVLPCPYIILNTSPMSNPRSPSLIAFSPTCIFYWDPHPHKNTHTHTESMIGVIIHLVRLYNARSTMTNLRQSPFVAESADIRKKYMCRLTRFCWPAMTKYILKRTLTYLGISIRTSCIYSVWGVECNATNLN